MTRNNCDPAPLAATLLLVAMVSVASAAAKPAPSGLIGALHPSPPPSTSLSNSSVALKASPTSTSSPPLHSPVPSPPKSSEGGELYPLLSSRNTTEEEDDDYEYYYDYDDYDYDYEYKGDLPFPLNMSEFHLPEEGDAQAPHVPRYMLELYADQTSKPPDKQLARHDLVRSFIASSTVSTTPSEDKNLETTMMHSDNGGKGVRTHSLAFNVTLNRKEKVTSATLRLYALITRDQYAYIGVERRVSIIMEIYNATGDASHVTVCQQDVYEVHNSWETFDVTMAVRYWLTRPYHPQILQIHIESVFSTAGDGGDLDVATVPKTDSEPLLLVYSKVGPHKQAKRELNLMISHEYDDEIPHSKTKRRKRRSPEGGTAASTRSKRSLAEEQEEVSNMIFDGNTLFPELPSHALTSLEGRRRPIGRKRRAKNSCKKKPMKVDFKDIGWDKWIIAPPSYEAYQCSGKCFYPLASHLSPTKHAVVQNLVHSLHPDRASRACCVPTKLGPISLLYLENGATTYEYGYNDMVVLACGCR